MTLTASPRLNACVSLLRRLRFVVIVFWIIIVVCGLVCSTPFFDGLGYSILPSKGLQAYTAEMKLEEYFPGTRFEGYLLVVIQSKSGQNVMTEQNHEFTSNFTSRLQQQNFAALGEVTTYWGVNTLAPLVAKRLVSPDQTMSLILISINQAEEAPAREVLVYAEDIIRDLKPFVPSDFRIMVTGEIAFHRDVTVTTQNDMRVDVISMPLSLSILALTLKSFRVALLPMVCLGISILFSFIMMYGVMQLTDITTVVPNVMMALTTALSLDYCLFLFSRYSEELREGAESDDAIRKSLLTAGEMVFVSGTSLLICSFSMTLLPVTMIQVIGIGLSLCVMNTMLVALTLVPSLVFIFPGFFSGMIDDGKILRKLFRIRTTDYDVFSEKPKTGVVGELQKSRWLPWTLFVLRHKYAMMFLMLLSLLPMVWLALSLQTRSTISLTFPQDCEATIALKAVEKEFGSGAVLPYTFVFVPKPPITNALSREFFANATTLLTALMTVPNTQMSFFNGILILGGKFVTYDQWLNAMTDPSSDPLDISIAAVTPSFANIPEGSTASPPTATAQRMQVALGFDPSGPKGEEWLYQTRDIIASQDWGVDLYLAKGGAPTIDMGNALMSQLPSEMLIMCGIVFLVMYAAFGSIVVPVRSILSLIFTLAWTFGTCQLVFHYGMLDWMGWFALSSQNIVHWVTPTMSLSLICGIALDCDIFLLTRIVEYREAGYTDEAALILGVFKTAGIITSAGLIMGVSFGSNVITQLPLRTANVFMITFAIIFDTFFVRAFVMPTVMGILGRFNFWPRKFPRADKTTAHLIKPPQQD